MSLKLLSIVIPTKNRYETLIPLVDALVNFANEDIELIIQDNSDDNSMVKNRYKNVKFVRYYYHQDWLSVVDNCDMGILHSNGEYVTFIGDDDAIVPQTIDIARLLSKNNIDSCSCSYPIYRWPAALNEKKNAFEYYDKQNSNYIPDLDRMLEKILKSGAHNKNGCPCVYHGIVKRAVLDKIFEATGSFFPGPSPDMANAVALLLFSKKHVVTNVPFIVDGYSKASTGHLTEVKKHVGQLAEQSFLPKDTVANWTPSLPKIWLPNTIWPESAIQALKRCGRADLADKLSIEAVYIKISIMYPQLCKLCFSMARKNSNLWQMLCVFINSGYSYIKKKLTYKKPIRIIKQEIDIETAIFETSNIIEKYGLLNSFEDFLRYRSK